VPIACRRVRPAQFGGAVLADHHGNTTVAMPQSAGGNSISRPAVRTVARWLPQSPRPHTKLETSKYAGTVNSMGHQWQRGVALLLLGKERARYPSCAGLARASHNLGLHSRIARSRQAIISSTISSQLVTEIAHASPGLRTTSVRLALPTKVRVVVGCYSLRPSTICSDGRRAELHKVSTTTRCCHLPYTIVKFGRSRLL